MFIGPVFMMGDHDDSTSEDISDTDIDSFILDKELLDESLSVPKEFLFSPETMSESVILPDFVSLDQETQERLQALLQAAGITKISSDGRAVADPDLLKRLTSSVSNALDEAAAAITRMKSDDKTSDDGNGTSVTAAIAGANNEEGESLLSLACSAGYYELAQVLLAMRTNLEDRGSKGDCTPLMEAASAGHADIVKLLIAHGADVNAQSSTGNTPLMYACASGHEEVVRVLLDAGADVDLNNENGHSPLMEAASAGHVAIARLLVDHGAQVNVQNNEFKVGLESPLTLACYKGHLQMVRYLLQAGNSSSPGRQEELHTALMEASMDGHVEVARLLLDAGAKVNLPTDSFESPLTLAACGGHAELAKLLLERKANLEEPNDEGYTPLMEAAREGHEDVCRLLLEWHADVNAQTEETGETALTLACCGGFQEVASLLLDHGADIEAGANTPLMEAAQEGHSDLVRFLIKRGANANATTASGDTPLTYAAENGHTEVCVALLDAGADLEHGADGGRTALMKAARAGHDCVVTMLVNKGADANRSTTANDHTALSLACTGGHLSTVELLLRLGADAQKKLKDGTTCIMEAAKGGHTTVVQLLLDWPSLHPVSPALNMASQTALALPAPCAEIAVPVMTTGDISLIPSSGVENPVNGMPASNLLPQFNLQLAMAAAAASGQNAASNCVNLKPNPLNLQLSNAVASGGSLGPILPTIPSSRSSESFSCDDKDIETDPLILAQTALLEQASEKLSAKDYLKLQELLKAQFKETAAQLANRVRSENSGSGVQSTPRKTSSSSASNNTASAAKNKKAELEQAMKELEQLKKTQHLYEQIQKALEAKAAAAAFVNEKAKAARVKSAPGKPAKDDTKKQDPVRSPPSPPHPPPSVPPPPPPPSILSNMVTPGSLQLQLPQLDVSQIQYVQQQFNLALQQQQQINAGYQFNITNPAATQMVFPEFAMIAGNSLTIQPASLQRDNKVINEAERGDSAASMVGLQTQMAVGSVQMTPELASAFAAVQAQHQQSVVANTIQMQQTKSPFDLSIPNAGFHFTPYDLLPPPPPICSSHSANQLTDSSLNVTFDLNDEAAVQIDASRSRSPVIVPPTVQENNTKGTQTSTATSVSSQPSGKVYQPHAGAFQPPNQPPPCGNVEVTATATSFQHHHHHHHHHQHHGVNLPSCQKQQHHRQAATGVDLNTQTESNHDTALTLACAGGHDELVLLLLQRGADIEHRDKKGFTPLILAATAGHAAVVEILLEHGANVEAQSERTKDTALSLACSGGRRDVVEILLRRGSNKEHRNVSDYTPLSLAASGGYTDIIQLLLQYGAEINSRTGSKLGISPLMLAAMNGHTQAVKLLLEKHADINAQIETNRNTALTLACFQGRHEVVKLLLEYRASVEHRAKTGLTPLMEAASGGYVDVGKVLLVYGADVNCAPVPATRDTALTIAADKGHAKFVELLLQHGAQVDSKTKKGCTALWLAANGGHLEVVQALIKYGAQVDEPDNRRVTPLMAAFRKGHVKVAKWLVRYVQQFPSDQECTRYLTTVTEKDLLAKCRQAAELIFAAKDRQAQEANKAAAGLLQELEQEQRLAETRRQAKQRQKEKKKMKRQAKKAVSTTGTVEKSNDKMEKEDNLDDEEDVGRMKKKSDGFHSGSGKMGKEQSPNDRVGDSSPSPAPSESRSISPSPERLPPGSNVRISSPIESRLPVMPTQTNFEDYAHDENDIYRQNTESQQVQNDFGDGGGINSSIVNEQGRRRRRVRRQGVRELSINQSGTKTVSTIANRNANGRHFVETKNASDLDGWSKATSYRNSANAPAITQRQSFRARGGRGDSGISSSTSVPHRTADDTGSIASGTAKVYESNVWKDSGSIKRQPNKILVSAQAIARVIGRGGQNINAIRDASGAHIEVEKQQKGQTDRLITIRGTPEGTKQAILMINGLINEPEVPVQEIVEKVMAKDRKAIETYANARPPSANAVLKTQSASSANASKGDAFPEISVWVPSPKPTKQRYQVNATTAKTTAASTVTSTTSTTSSVAKQRSSGNSGSVPTAKGSEYTQFGNDAGLNVWQQRAVLLQQKKQANFASVAATGLSNAAAGIGSGKATESGKTSPEKIRDGNPPSAEDLKKAPGYRSQTSITAGNSPLQNMRETPHQSKLAAPYAPNQRDSNFQGTLVLQPMVGHTTASDEKKSPGNAVLYSNTPSASTPLKPFEHASAALLDEAAQAIAAAAFSSSITPPRSSESAIGYYSTANVDFGTLEDTGVTDLSAYFSSLGTPKTSFSSPTSYSHPPTQRSSLGFDNAPASQMVGGTLYDTDNGRRSAGATTAYFSPISLPRPASATASVNMDAQGVYGRTHTPPILNSDSQNLAAIIEQLQQQRSHQLQDQYQYQVPIGGGHGRNSDDIGNPVLPNVNSEMFASILEAWGLSSNEKGPNESADWSSELNDLSEDLAKLQAMTEGHQIGHDFGLPTDYDYADVAAAVSKTAVNFDPDALQQALLLTAANWGQNSNVAPQDLQTSAPGLRNYQQMYMPPPFSASIPPPGFVAPPPSIRPAVSLQQTPVPPPPLGVFQHYQPVWSTTEREWKFAGPDGSMASGPFAPHGALTNNAGNVGAGDGYGFTSAYQSQHQNAQPQSRGWNGSWNPMTLQ